MGVLMTDFIGRVRRGNYFRLFQDVDNNPDRLFIPATLRQEPEWDLSGGLTVAQAALIEFFKRMRPGDPATLENARAFLEEQLFDQRHYDLERVGRYKLNQKLDLDVPIPHRTITKRDIIRLIRRMIRLIMASSRLMILTTWATAV